MKRLLSLALIAGLLAGCGKFEQGVARWTGYSEQCIDGVIYLQFSSGASVKYRPDGSVATCK